MAHRLTTLLLIALMLALPLRAVAGVAMVGCAMPQHSVPAAVAQDMGHEAAAHMSADACHASGEGDAGPAHGHCHDSGDAPAKHAGSTCSACGDCCVGALSIPAASHAWLDSDFSSPPVSFADQPYAGFQPEGPDRPPRHTVL